MTLIGKRVKDPIITKLIKDGLKAKVFSENGESFIPELGTPQGGILSPLLSNIYLHEFDKYMEEIKEEYENQNAEKGRKRNPLAMKLLKAGKKKEYYRMKIPFYEPKDSGHIKIKYVRHADDFLIAISGSRKLAEEIRERIAQ